MKPLSRYLAELVTRGSDGAQGAATAEADITCVADGGGAKSYWVTLEREQWMRARGTRPSQETVGETREGSLAAPWRRVWAEAGGAGTGWLPKAVLNVAIGVAGAAVAVALRLVLHLPPIVLPFFTVVVAICLVTVAAGLTAGMTTALAGGLLTWYLVLSPGSWTLPSDEAYSLLGYVTVAIVILTTSDLYRRSERRRQQIAFAKAMEDAQQQRVFAGELSHRLKNAMTIVQAIASQTFPRGLPEVTKFEGRLKALANAHNLMMDHVEQPTASVRLLIEAALAPFAEEAARIRAEGPDVLLGSQQVVSVALALHELGTNAVKHGALRAPEGWVSVEWRQVDSKMQLEWREHGGPPVSAPTRRGFGTRLLMRAAMGTDLKFETDGLRCIITSELAPA